MRLQEWIHRMEEGAGAKYVRWFGLFIGFAALALIFNLFCFHNFTNPEAMDAAQLGRNISRGDGFTTLLVRPLSVGLTREARADKSALLREGHRDISNPPVYPLLLAGVLAVTPDPGDLLAIKNFDIYLPNLYITILNQVLLGVGAILVFRLARRWFNRAVGWMSVVLFLFTELYWRFSVSGLSTILLIDMTLLLAWWLGSFEERVRGGGAPSKTLVLALGIGALVAALLLTRYAVGWLLLPVLAFVAVCGGPARWRWVGAVAGAFLVLTLPWMLRNVLASGLPFGTATYAIIEGTPAFTGDTLQRMTEPSMASLPGQTWSVFVSVLHKGVTGMHAIVTSDLPKAGGNWMWTFFLAGLFVKFQGVNLSRMRWFAVGALLLLIPVQALTQTYLATEVPQINSENLLVLMSPFILIFGVGLFFVLFESLALPSAAQRAGVLGGFVVMVSLPLGLTLLPPGEQVNASPYYPPRIQQVARYMEPREMWMSDIPWAMAWYGDRQCVWLTRTAGRDFFELNDMYKTVNGLFVSMRTGDAKFVSNWFGGTERGWASLLLQTFVLREIPRGFPLRHSPDGLSTLGELLLTDKDRWSEAAPVRENVQKD